MLPCPRVRDISPSWTDAGLLSVSERAPVGVVMQARPREQGGPGVRVWAGVELAERR